MSGKHRPTPKPEAIASRQELQQAMHALMLSVECLCNNLSWTVAGQGADGSTNPDGLVAVLKQLTAEMQAYHSELNQFHQRVERVDGRLKRFEQFLGGRFDDFPGRSLSVQLHGDPGVPR